MNESSWRLGSFTVVNLLMAFFPLTTLISSNAYLLWEPVTREIYWLLARTGRPSPSSRGEVDTSYIIGRQKRGLFFHRKRCQARTTPLRSMAGHRNVLIRIRRSLREPVRSSARHPSPISSGREARLFIDVDEPCFHRGLEGHGFVWFCEGA